MARRVVACALHRGVPLHQGGDEVIGEVCVRDVLALENLADRANDRPSTFSGGMKRCLNIAAALMHDPELLILDEPTVGVDPQSRNDIFDTLENAEVARMCTEGMSMAAQLGFVALFGTLVLWRFGCAMR